MTTTVQLTTFIPEIRDLLRDPATLDGAAVTPHYPDSLLLRSIAEAFSELWKTRPASRYIQGMLTEQDFGADLTSATVVYDSRWRQGIVYHATALVYETGTPDTVNAQFAQQFRALARNEFLT